MADDVTKRMNYFDRQFLRATDFQVEQAYHLDRRRRHNRLLHTRGIAEGLIVTPSQVPGEERAVRVTPGTAYDVQGQEVVLSVIPPATDVMVDLSTVGVSQGPPVSFSSPLFLTIAYGEEPSDPNTDGIDDKTTRILEEPQLEAGTTPPTDLNRLLLAVIERDTSDGHITSVDTNPPGRLRAGSLPGGSVGPLELADGAVQSRHIALADAGTDQTPTVGSGVKAGHLMDGAVIASKLADGAVTVPKLADGAVIASKLADSAVSNRSIQDDTINEAKFDAITRGKLVTNGDSHDHTGGDGAAINHSSVVKDDGRNPHGTTAADVGAVATSGGSISGSLTIAPATGRLISFGEGSLFDPLLVIQSDPGLTRVGLSVTGDLLHVIDGQTTFNGLVRFNGGKSGYVVDWAINRSGVTLRTGDVVKLTGTPIVRFMGELNKIPIPEVTLAERENDPAVIGIVDREAIPGQDEPDTRSAPEDPTSIADGGELLIVTLGTYAHCKVDATETPIEVGDLLTSSANPGHAKKATDPKIGSIIGKALEPFKEGTGYIAVFVNAK